MAKVSNIVNDKVRELYALLASVCAQRAIDEIKVHGDIDESELMAEQMAKFLAKSSANCARWTYRTPRIDR